MAEILWYYAHDQQQLGPVSSAELKRLAAANQLFPDDLIWREGMDEWAPAVRVKGLFPPREATEAAAAEAAASAAAPQPPAEPPAPTSDVRLANPYATASAPPTETAAPTSPGTAAPAVSAPPVASQGALPLDSQPRDHLGPGLRTVLILVQALLWATCVMVVVLGGVILLKGIGKTKTPTDQAATAAISCTLFVGSYVLARAGEHVARLVEQFLNMRSR